MTNPLRIWVFPFVLASFTILTSSFATAQNINLYLVKENIETVTTNSELIASDPLNEKSTNFLPMEMEKKTEEVKKFDFSMESSITPTSKYITLPLGFTRKKLSVSCAIPYYIRRGMNYAHGTESASGIGDLSIKASYKSNREKLNSEFHICIKLPTGNESKQQNGYLVPLGTGSTDIMGQVILSYLSNRNLLYFNLSYRMNGAVDRITQITYPSDESVETINYHVKNGNTLMLNSSYSYKIWKYAALVAGFSATANGKGKIDQKHTFSTGQDAINYNGLNASQNFILADVNPSLVFMLSRFNLSLGCKVPVYTKVSERNSEETRKVSYSLRLAYTIH